MPIIYIILILYTGMYPLHGAFKNMLCRLLATVCANASDGGDIMTGPTACGRIATSLKVTVMFCC